MTAPSSRRPFIRSSTAASLATLVVRGEAKAAGASKMELLETKVISHLPEF